MRRPILRQCHALVLLLFVTSFGLPTFATPYFRLRPVNPKGLNVSSYPAGTEVIGDTIYVSSTPARAWFDVHYGNWGTSPTAHCSGGPANGQPCTTGCPGGHCFDLFAVQTLQFNVDMLALANGVGAALTPATVACNGSAAVCENELGVGFGYNTPNDDTNGCGRDNNTNCFAAFLESGRPDNVDFGIGLCAQSQSYIGCGKTALGVGQTDDGGEYYLGTFVLDVPDGASGNYVVRFDPAGTLMWIETNEVLDDYDLQQAFVKICDANECGEKNRYLAVSPTTLPPTAVAAGGIRIQALDINGAPVIDPPPQWVGLPQAYTDPANGQQFYAAELTCTPFVFDWISLPPDAMVHVFGANVVPGSRYEVRAGDSSCVDDPDEWDLCLTTPTIARTAAFGDVIKPFGGIGQPNFLDISALVHAFKVLPTAVIKPRAQLAGTVPNPAGAVSFLDISAGVSAFKGESFPFTGPEACP